MGLVTEPEEFKSQLLQNNAFIVGDNLFDFGGELLI